MKATNAMVCARVGSLAVRRCRDSAMLAWAAAFLGCGSAAHQVEPANLGTRQRLHTTLIAEGLESGPVTDMCTVRNASGEPVSIVVACDQGMAVVDLDGLGTKPPRVTPSPEQFRTINSQYFELHDVNADGRPEAVWTAGVRLDRLAVYDLDGRVLLDEPSPFPEGLKRIFAIQHDDDPSLEYLLFDNDSNQVAFADDDGTVLGTYEWPGCHDIEFSMTSLRNADAGPVTGIIWGGRRLACWNGHGTPATQRWVDRDRTRLIGVFAISRDPGAAELSGVLVNIVPWSDGNADYEWFWIPSEEVCNEQAVAARRLTTEEAHRLRAIDLDRSGCAHLPTVPPMFLHCTGTSFQSAGVGLAGRCLSLYLWSGGGDILDETDLYEDNPCDRFIAFGVHDGAIQAIPAGDGSGPIALAGWGCSLWTVSVEHVSPATGPGSAN